MRTRHYIETTTKLERARGEINIFLTLFKRFDLKVVSFNDNKYAQYQTRVELVIN